MALFTKITRLWYGAEQGEYFECDNTPVIDSSDSSKYFEGYGHKFYNSAIYYNNGNIYQLVLFDTASIVVWHNAPDGVYNNYQFDTPGNALYTSSLVNIPGTDMYYSNYAYSSGRYIDAQPPWTITSDLPVFYDIDEFEAYVTNPLITYQWSSVPAISGKMGILSLSMIKNEDIGDGSPVTAANDNVIDRITAGSSIDALGSGLTKGQSADVIYSGDTFKLIMTRGQETGGLRPSYYDLKFCTYPTTGGVYTPFYTYRLYMIPWANNKKYLGFIIDEENQVAALNIIYRYTSGVDQVVDYCTPGTGMSESEMTNMYIWIKGSGALTGDTTDNLIDDEGDGGGDPHERINNPIPTPGVPYLSAYDTGFLSQYLCTKGELKSLASFLWTDSFVENVAKFFGDPREIIMGVNIFPVKPDHSTSKSNIKAGGIDTTIQGYKVTKQFQRYDFGYCEIEKSYSRGIFYDYSPFLTAKIYLPYCGEHDLNLSDIMGKTLHLEYTVDHVSGVCCAHLTIYDKNNELPNECHYNYTGQMGVQIPLSAEDFGGFYRAILSAGAAVGGALATGATGGLSAPLAIGATANALNNISNMGKDIQYTSGGGSISGALASEYPYITLEEPRVFKDGFQRHFMGYPHFSTKQLKDVSGFTKIMAIHLDGLSCTESEREAIRSQLSNGVIIQTGDTLPTPSSGDELYKIMLLTNLSDVDTIGKKFAKDANDEVAYIEIKSDLIYNQNFTRVGLLINQFDATCNYVYIPAFGRRYYVDSITVESGSMCRLDLICDATDSFWSELKECTAMIEANESEADAKLLINNNTWFMKQNKRIVTKVFTDGELTDSNGVSCFRKGTDAENPGDECFLITIAGDTND